jgi:alkane 1-monooxygenase
MKLSDAKYILAYTVPLSTYVSLTQTGLWTTFTFLYAFVLIPLFELFLSGTSENFSAEEEEDRKKNILFDILLWLVVPIQYGLLFLYLYAITWGNRSLAEIVGMTLSMGISCSVLGINVAHELGHRSNKFEQFLSKALLLTSLYMHFFIEHNRGHHKNVATPLDPASSRLGESLYRFWWRSVKDGFFSAWEIEKNALEKRQIPVWSFQNEMLQFVIIQKHYLDLLLPQ